MRLKGTEFTDFLFTVVVFSLLAFSILYTFTGCAQKPQTIVKYKYIEKKCPPLTVYQGCEVNLSLTAYNKNNQICIKEWNGCIDKKAFIDLVKYIKNIRSVCKKYEYQIIEYNKRFTDPSN